ncbi:MAG: hypothetical protein AB1458_00615 [Bacteroidota bacterium]
MSRRFDNLWIGAVLGLLSPIAVFFAFYLIKYSHMSLGRFFDYVSREGTLSPRISLCVIINLLIFYIFIWTHRYYSARGIILSTFIYAAFVIYVKFIA